MGNVGEDQVDFGGPGDDEHVAGFVTETVPLLDQRIERADTSPGSCGANAAKSCVETRKSQSE